MNALAQDQLGRLRELFCCVGVSFALYVGKTPEQAYDLTGPRLPEGSYPEDYKAKVCELLFENECHLRRSVRSS